MDFVDKFLQQPHERMETDGCSGAAGQVSATQQAANNSNSWTSTGTMVSDYHVQGAPRQIHAAQPQHAAGNQSLDMLFDMDGVDDLPEAHPHEMTHVDMELLPDVPPVGVDLDSLHLHASPVQPQQAFLQQHGPARQQQEQQAYSMGQGPLQQQHSMPAELQHQQQHQQQMSWGSPSWQQHKPQQQATWMPVPAPAVQYSSSWGGGPHTMSQPFAGDSGSGPFMSLHHHQQLQQQQCGSQPSAGHWGVQLRGGGAQQLSSSVPTWGSGHLAADQQHFQQHPVPLMYDFGAHQGQPQAGQLPLPSLRSPPRSPVRTDAAPLLQQRAHTAPPPRRTSARLPRIDYSVFAGEVSSSESEEEELSDGSARSSPAGTPRPSAYANGRGRRGGSSESPADSGNGSPGGFGAALRPSSYSAGGAGRFGGWGGSGAAQSRGAGISSETPKSLPTGSNFLKSRSGRTVRPSGHRLRDSSPEPLTPTTGRDRERSYGGGGGGSATGPAALLGRPGSGTLSKRKRLVQPPAALRDGADADFNQRRKQHNPWTREETEALVEGVEHCGGAGHWQDIKRLGYPAIAARSAVDLKDKWRNLLRIAELPPELAAARVDKKREAPSMEILERVRALTLAGQHRAAAGEARAAASSRSRARGRRT